MSIRGSRYYNQLCADFNGTDEYMYRDDPSFKADTAGAWSFWVKLDAVFGSDDADFVFGYGVRSGSNNSRFQIGPRRIALTGTSTYMAILHVPTNGGTISGYSGTTTALSAGVWTHVVVQSNGTAWSMWINGVSQTITQWGGSGSNNGNWYGDVSGTNHRMTIGVQYLSNAIGANFYAGLLDEVTYLSGRAMTSGEVAEIYNGGTPKDPRGLSFATELEAIYRMGDRGDTGATILDRAVSNDLTLVNMDASNYVPV